MDAVDLTRAALNAIGSELSKPEERLYKQAARFILPVGGKLMTTDLALLPDHVTLPFPVTAIEYRCEDLVHQRAIDYLIATGYHADMVSRWKLWKECRDRVVVIACQREPRAAIELTVMQRSQRRGTWKRVIEKLSLPCRRDRILRLQQDPIGRAPRLSDALSVTPAEHAGLVAEWLTVFDPAMAIYALCEVLASADDVGERFGCAPLQSFRFKAMLPVAHNYCHTLTMTGPETITVATASCKGPKQIPEGIRRQHVRKGHWRHYASGKKVWIGPALISEGVAPKPQKIIHDR